MDPRAAPLPGDTQYFLDGAIEAWEINAFVHDTLNLFGKPDVIDGIIEGDTRRGSPFTGNRQYKCLRLSDYAHEIARDMGPKWQRALFAASIPWEIHEVGELSQVLAGWNYEDSTVGGALRPFKKNRHVQRGRVPTKRVARRLYAPEAIRRYVKHTTASFLRHHLLMAQPQRALPWPSSLEDGQLIVETRQKQLERYRDLVQDQIAKMMAKPVPRVLKKSVRKKLIKSASIASAVVGPETVREFISGKPVDLEGETVTLEIARRGSLTQDGHGAVEVGIKDKGGERLGRLCVYFEGTPALDQLAAFALHAQSGSEMEILQAGNLYNVTAAGAGHPLLSKMVREVAAAPILDPRARERALQARYFVETGAIYADAAFVQMWGRDAKRLRSFQRAA